MRFSTIAAVASTIALSTAAPTKRQETNLDAAYEFPSDHVLQGN